MQKIQIHQFSPSAHLGDGITNGMFYFQKILHELGFISYIYAENFEDELQDKVKKHTQIDNKNPNQLLFIHYSIYYDFDNWINKLKTHKHMIYHNITPYEFFDKGSFLYNMCKKGKEYLPELASKVEGSIGDSPLNTDELIEAKFNQPKTISLLMDINKITSAPFNKTLFDEKSKEFNIIFIGRVAQNKAQHDLIEIANSYKDMDENFKLYIIGGVTDEAYFQKLQKLIQTYDLQENVILTGKISNEDLYAYYRAANLFLCMSEHEGFGMPLVESMLFDLPIFAYNSSNIKNTLNGGGVLFNEKSPQKIAAMISLLKENPSLKREILNTQREAKAIYEHDLIVKQVVSYLSDFNIQSSYTPEKKEEQIKYQFEGPFDSSYSLAILNKNAALAYEKKFPNQVSLYSTEGHGDFDASPTFLKENPLLNKLHNSAKPALQTEVTFRYVYPPRVTGMKGELNLLNLYGWEESAFPYEYVEEFNQNLNGITAISNYTKDVLQKNGVKVPIKVLLNIAGHLLNVKSKSLPLTTKKSFKFLHISSCFPRKGVDILLKAYTEAFTIEDDVTLIIKTFPNPHNDVEKQIKSLQETKKNIAEIILINEDLDDAYIKWLYENTHALVAPSRGEGFGLPMAEAMLHKLPLITTAYGGQVDFAKEENAWLIEYEFAKAQTHLNLFDSYWAEPSKEHLKKLLIELPSLNKKTLSKKVEKAYEEATQKLLWNNYVQNTETFIKELKEIKVFDTPTKNIAWVSSYNTKCGIASYSEFIIENLDTSDYNIEIFASKSTDILDATKETNIKRVWNNRYDEENNELIEELTSGSFSSLVINFNFGFFSMPNLASIIDALAQKKIKTTIIFHSVADVTAKGQGSSLSWILPSLKRVSHLLVHTINDMNRLKKLGLTNIDLLSHGVQNRRETQLLNQEHTEDFTIASYGFMLPHKGILELILAFAKIEAHFPKAKLLLLNALYPAEVSKIYAQKCQNKVEELKLTSKIIFNTEFLSDDATFSLLESADLIVLPYHLTQESSSASVRHALATRKPVLCTSQAIFDDVKEIVHFVKDSTPTNIAQKLTTLLSNKTVLNEKISKQNSWIIQHDWRKISRRFEYFLN